MLSQENFRFTAVIHGAIAGMSLWATSRFEVVNWVILMGVFGEDAEYSKTTLNTLRFTMFTLGACSVAKTMFFPNRASHEQRLSVAGTRRLN